MKKILKCIDPKSLSPEEFELAKNNSDFHILGHSDFYHDGKTLCPNHHLEVEVEDK